MALRWGWQCGGRQQWLRLSLLITFAFVGHDLLMAAETMAASAATVAVHEDPASSRHDPETASPQHGESSEHPATCHIGQRAAPRSGDDSAPVDHHVASTSGELGILAASSTSAIVAWDEPRRSPGALRAWLQVYLI
jgi:hypothetical protein